MERSKPVQKVFTCGDDIEQNNLQVFLLILILKIYAHDRWPGILLQQRLVILG